MIVALSMILDAIFGEPKWLWDRFTHPAVLMGRCVSFVDERFNQGRARKLKGILSFGALCLGFGLLGVMLEALPFGVVDVVIGAILIAQKSLVEHVAAVASALRLSLDEGRRRVGWIVGRDTKEMDRAAVSRAAIESAAENFSDGVIAPIFWFALLGLPGLLIYKITNTADSMIGYRTPRHEQFGWAAARFDDVLNWVPARITALLIALTTRPLPSFGDIRKDAALHRSPNAGWPEAAMSRVLRIALSGPRSYEGEMRYYPFVNAGARENVTPDDINRACRTLWQAWGITFVGVVLLGLI